MATSGQDTITRTATEVISRAFRLINVLPATATIPATDKANGVVVLNDMMQSWTTDGVTPWRKNRETLAPVSGAAEYTITERPLEIIEMRWVLTDGTEVPMDEITHDEYFDIPNKTTQGTPSQYYIRRNRASTAVFVWPTVPTSVTTEVFKYTYNRRTEIVVTPDTDEIDVPQEWLEAVTYNLAARLGDEYGSKGEIYNRVLMRAEKLYEDLKMYEREGTVAFYPDETGF